MKRQITLTHEFVDYLPNDLKEGIIYVSMPFATVAHKCCCGCGNEVITPLSPTDWKLIFDGETISLDPSIGNWSFPCQSHYWIKRSKVRWAPQWSQEKIELGRAQDVFAKERYLEQAASPKKGKERRPKQTLWEKLKSWLS